MTGIIGLEYFSSLNESSSWEEKNSIRSDNFAIGLFVTKLSLISILWCVFQHRNKNIHKLLHVCVGGLVVIFLWFVKYGDI